MVSDISSYDKAVSNFDASSNLTSPNGDISTKLSNRSGSIRTKITKSQVESYTSKFKSGSSNKLGAPNSGTQNIDGASEQVNFGDVQFKDQSSDSDNLISYGSDDDSNDEVYSGGQAPLITNSFDTLAAAVGAIGGKISKEQLVMFLQSLVSVNNPDYATSQEEIALVKNLIAQFDTLSNGSSYITSLAGVKEPQDYSTVTKAQVTPPIDLRV